MGRILSVGRAGVSWAHSVGVVRWIVLGRILSARRGNVSDVDSICDYGISCAKLVLCYV